MDGYGFLTSETQQAEQCLRRKFAAKGLSYTVTSTYRTRAYQAHLRELWNKWTEINGYKESDPAKFEACRNVKAELDAEIRKPKDGVACTLPGRRHCLDYPPADNSLHSERKAFDINRLSVNALTSTLRKQTPRQTIQQYIDAAPACGLTWGRAFGDWVHFGLNE